MFCAHCGKEVPAGAPSCPACGAPAQAQEFAPRSPGGFPAVPPRRGLPWYFFAGLFVAALAPLVLIAGLIYVRVQMARKSSPMRAVEDLICQMHLSQVGVSCRNYERKHKAWPPTLRAAHEDDRTTSPGIFVCPCTAERPGDDARERTWEAFEGDVGYEYRPPPASITGDGTVEIPMAWDREEHPDGKRTVVYSSGRVESLDPAAFAAKFGK